jgi:hypothetical protein
MRRKIDGRIAVTWYAAALLAIVSVEYTYLSIKPREHWFNYERIAVIEPVIRGEALLVASYIDRRRPVDMSWKDELRCDTGDGWGMRHIDTQPSNVDEAPRRSASQPAYWVYKKDIPDRPAVCIIRSVATAHLKYFITKRQVKESEPFPFP